MRTISSLRRSYTMRVLILSAFLACATAAPSHVYAGLYEHIVPFAPSPTLPLIRAPIAVIPQALPTVPPGDIQAAQIDAQVKAEDQARAFADQARELSEIAAENQNEGVLEANDMAKERSDLAFWTAEEEKQRALDAERVAAAHAEAVAARSAYVPYEEPTVAESPAAESPMPEAAAKAVEMPAATDAAAESPAEAPKEGSLKMAEPEPAEPEKPADSVQVESADMKAEPAQMESQAAKALPEPVIASYISSRGYPLVAPVAYIQPGLPAVGSSAIYPGHFVAPTLLQPQW